MTLLYIFMEKDPYETLHFRQPVHWSATIQQTCELGLNQGPEIEVYPLYPRISVAVWLLSSLSTLKTSLFP